MHQKRDYSPKRRRKNGTSTEEFKVLLHQPVDRRIYNEQDDAIELSESNFKDNTAVDIENLSGFQYVNILKTKRANSEECDAEGTNDSELSSQLNMQLIDAVHWNDFLNIERLLQRGANPNAVCFPAGMSACHWATFTSEMALSILIKYGADKMRPDIRGLTPLHLAAYAGNFNQIALLLDIPDVLQKKIKFDESLDEDEMETLRRDSSIVDIKCGDDVLMDMYWKTELISCFSDFFIGFYYALRARWTPLHLASYSAHFNCVRLLLAAGANPHATDDEGRTALDVAGALYYRTSKYSVREAPTINPEKFTALVKKFISLNCHSLLKKSDDFGSPLHTAVRIDSLEGVKILVEAGIPVDWVDEHGWTALHWCISEHRLEHLQILVTGKCETSSNTVNVKDRLGCTILHAAVQANWIPGVDLCLNSRASIDDQDYEGNTPLHYAVCYDDLEISKKLLKLVRYRNIIDTVNKWNETPLFLAVQYGRPENIKLLLQKGAVTTVTDLNGWNMLHAAAWIGDSETFKLIFNHNVNNTDLIKSKLTNEGKSVLDMAVCSGNTDIIKLLLDNGAFLSVANVTNIIYKLPKPTVVLENILDHYIFINPSQNKQDIDCTVIVNYAVLMTDTDQFKQVNLLKAIIATGNRHGQKNLLKHPLVESFLYLKWKAFEQFFYMSLATYAVFVISLTLFVISQYYFEDTKTNISDIYHGIIGACFIISTLIIICVEVLIKLVNIRTYFCSLDNWIKLSSIFLAVSLGFHDIKEHEWSRIVASIALLLSWIAMMNLLSTVPKLGFIIPMFGKVALKVTKILLIFMFLLIGFALSFMIQFHATPPFEDPWSAFVKVLVMMTSEFDYSDVIAENNTKVVSKSLIVMRIVFVAFVIFVAIVLMNLMLGVAVDDIHNLQKLGNIVGLEKQVEVIGALEKFLKDKSRINNFFQKYLPRSIANPRWFNERLLTIVSIILAPNKVHRNNKKIPTYLREGLLKIAFQKHEMNDATTNQIHNNNEILNDKMLEKTLNDDRNKRESTNKNNEESIQDLNNKIEQVVKHINEMQNNYNQKFKEITDQMLKSECVLSEINFKTNEMYSLLKQSVTTKDE